MEDKKGREERGRLSFGPIEQVPGSRVTFIRYRMTSIRDAVPASISFLLRLLLFCEHV